jgi:cytochrome c biogenesis protein CcmG/thiol:disulfide interchange protein DsbE
MSALGRWLALTAVVAGVVTVTLLLAFGLRGGTSQAASPLQGRTAPDFTLPGLDGDRHSAVRLSSLRGQVVVVNFWASWCTQCQAEQNALDQTWQRFRNAGVVVLGVDVQDAAGDARAYAARAGASYPLVVDRTSRTALAYGLRGIPETYVIDRHGALVHRLVGAVSASRLATLVDPLLGGGDR